MIIYILPLAIPGIGSIALIVGGIVFLFGAKKIPELMKGIGGGIKEFKKASKEEAEEETKEK
jgi:sec-independent protein translocase protein TatA